MIDSINSLATVLSALTGTGTAGDSGPADPTFMQVLAAIAGPDASGITSSTALQAAITAAASSILPGTDLTQGLFGMPRNGNMPGQRTSNASEKQEPGTPETAIEMLLALLSAAASQIQPWQIQSQDTSKAVSAASGNGSLQPGACLPTGMQTMTLSPQGKVLQLQQAVAGQDVPRSQDTLTDLIPNGFRALLPQGQVKQEPDAILAPVVAPGRPEASLTDAQPGPIEQKTDGQAIQIVTGRNAGQVQESKALKPDAQPVAGSGADPTGALPIVGRDQGSVSSPAANHALLAADLAPVAQAGASGKPVSTEDRRGEASQASKGHGLGTILGHNVTLSVDPTDGGNSASQNGGFKDNSTWNPAPAAARIDRLDSPASGQFPASVLSTGPSTALISASVVDQIARRAQVILSRGRTGLNIQLEPKELGKVRVYVGLGSEGLHVKLDAEASDTRGILQASLPQLKNALESQGLKVNRFDLAFNSGASTFGSAQGNAQQQPRMGGGPAPQHYKWEEDSTSESAASLGALKPESLVDYRI